MGSGTKNLWERAGKLLASCLKMVVEGSRTLEDWCDNLQRFVDMPRFRVTVDRGVKASHFELPEILDITAPSVELATDRALEQVRESDRGSIVDSHSVLHVERVSELLPGTHPRYAPVPFGVEKHWTLGELEAKKRLSAGPLKEGEVYILERASFGQANDPLGKTPVDFFRAHVILRHAGTGERFVLLPEANAQAFLDHQLLCHPVQS